LTESRDDPILDVCLEEILGGQRPPDLKGRILSAYERDAAQRVTGAEGPPHVIVAPASRQPKVPRRAASPAWISAAIMAGIVLGGTTLGLLALRWSEPVADRPRPPAADTHDPAPVAAAEVPPDFGLAASEPTTDRDYSEEPPNFGNFPPANPLPDFDEDTVRPSVSPLAFDQVVGLIDAAIRAGWDAHGIQPSTQLPDSAWCHSAYERLLGRSPTPGELEAFQSDPERADLVRHLCLDPRHREDFSRHWSQLWANSLVGKTGRPAAERRLRLFIEESLLEGESLVELVATMFCADRDGEGAGSYRSAHRGPKGIQLTSHAGRVFLGRRLRCAQCHHHPTDSQLTQSRFWEMNALMRQLAGSNQSEADNETLFFDTPGGELKAASPSLLGMSLVGRGALDRDASPSQLREALASGLTASVPFRRAMVNQVWSLMFGFGFTRSVGGAGPQKPVSHASVLAVLSDQLAAREFDLPTLVSWLAASEPFGLNVESGVSQTADRPRQGTRAFFSHRYAGTAPSAPGLADLLVAFRESSQPSAAIGTTARLAPTGPDLQAESLAALPDLPTHGDLLKTRSVHTGPTPMVTRLLASNLSTDDKLSHLFWELLDRSPKPREQRLVKTLLDSSPDEAAAWLDTWWAIVQCDEYDERAFSH
jgi:hypothetical protein